MIIEGKHENEHVSIVLDCCRGGIDSSDTWAFAGLHTHMYILKLVLEVCIEAKFSPFAADSHGAKQRPFKAAPTMGLGKHIYSRVYMLRHKFPCRRWYQKQSTFFFFHDHASAHFV